MGFGMRDQSQLRLVRGDGPQMDHRLQETTSQEDQEVAVVEEVEEKVVEAQEISSQDSTRMDALLNHRLRHLLQLRRLLPWRTMDGALSKPKKNNRGGNQGSRAISW